METQTPCWHGLEAFAKAFPAIRCHEYMWMGAVVAPNGMAVHAYKHDLTRKHLYLDNAGHAYGHYTGVNGFIDPVDAVRRLQLINDQLD